MSTSDLFLSLYSSRVIGGHVSKTAHSLDKWPDLYQGMERPPQNALWAIAELWLENVTDDDDRVLLQQWIRDT